MERQYKEIAKEQAKIIAIYERKIERLTRERDLFKNATKKRLKMLICSRK